jgi:hypothetical protein
VNIIISHMLNCETFEWKIANVQLNG